MIPLPILSNAVDEFMSGGDPLTAVPTSFSLGVLDSFGPVLAAASVQDLKLKLLEVLTVIMMFGFLYGTIRIIGGAMQIRRGEIEEGKQSIIAGALIAAAPMIMRILFGIFLAGDSTL